MALSEKQRIKRMRQVWLAAGPNGFEVAAARKRYFAERAASASAAGFRWYVDLAWGFGAVAALVVGYEVWTSADHGIARNSTASNRDSEAVSTAAAIQTPALSSARSAPAPLTSATSGLVIADSGQASLELAGSRLPIAPGVRYQVGAGERAVVSFGGQSSVVIGPQVIEFTFEADRASGFVMHLSDPSQGGVKAPETREQSSKRRVTQVPSRPNGAVDLSSSQATSWTKVARAMREGDQSTAERELLQLSSAGTAENRDSAALALAQLWLARGEVSRARPALHELAREAKSPVVKRRAAELFAGLPAE